VLFVFLLEHKNSKINMLHGPTAHAYCYTDLPAAII